jgi:UDP-N-acetylmuramoylalanine--D-glutamate ligase
VAVVGLAGAAAPATRLLELARARVRLEPIGVDADLRDETLIVVTAAAALAATAVTTARAAGVAVLGDLDLGWRATEAEALAVAPAPGAAVALRLTRTALAGQGRPVLVAGGGEAALAALAEGIPPDGLVVVEPTPAQLATAQMFRPRVAIVLPGASTGAAALVAHQTPLDCLVVATDDPAGEDFARRARAHVVRCSARHALDHGVYLARGRVAARLNGHVEEIGPAPGIPESQMVPLLAATACALWAGAAPDAIACALGHRRAAAELLPVINGRAAGAPRPAWLEQPVHGRAVPAVPAPTEAP